MSLFLIVSCGKDEEEKKSTPKYKYSYCGTVESLNNQMKINTTNGSYNLTFENNNQTMMNQMYQYANSNQQICVYSNQEAQSAGGGNTGYTGYSLPNILVQQIGSGTTNSGVQGNYSVSLCGMIFASYNYGGNNGQPIYMIQVSGQQVSQYQIQANNNNVSSVLSQIQSQQNGCVYANQQPSQVGYGLTVQAEQVVLQ